LLPRAADTLLAALERYPEGRWEDRLTEVFASALAALPELAGWFVAKAGGPVPAQTTTFEVTTQLTWGGGGRPDMEILYNDSHGRRCCVLSEHKIRARLTSYQHLAYGDWERNALVLVAPSSEIAQYKGDFDKCLTWLDVALAMIRIGKRHEGADWRKAARDPDTPSRLRILLETFDFLRRQDVGISSLSPMDDHAIQTYGELRHTRSAMRNFLEIVHAHPRIQSLGPSPIWTERQDTQWWFFGRRPLAVFG